MLCSFQREAEAQTEGQTDSLFREMVKDLLMTCVVREKDRL